MNIGLVLSLCAGLVWALGNVIDKVSVTKLVKSPLALLYIFMIFSFIAGIAISPFSIHYLNGQDVLRFGGLSIFYTLATFLYFLAMQKDEPSRVIPLYSLVILFLSVFSAIFLGEIFNLLTYVAIALLIAGTIGITARGNFSSVLHSRALGIMILSSICYALAYVVMKSLLKTHTAVEVFSYQRIFTGFVGLILLPFAFRHLRGVWGQLSKKRYLGLCFLSEFFGESGALLFIVASSLWYVTLVETVVNIQFVFIFLFGILVTKQWPQLYTEGIEKRTILQKIISIGLIIGGIFIISQ